MNLRDLLPRAQDYLACADLGGVPSWRPGETFSVAPLAQGEYNMNYLVRQGNGAWVLRVNVGTQIAFHLPQPGHAALRIYNINGQLVRTVRDTDLEAGKHQVHWDGLDGQGWRVASGVYFAQARVGARVENRKLVLLR